jgi:YHS domain-containing protein
MLAGGAPAAAAPTGDDVINAKCPISGEPVNARIYVEHDGHKIGLCCGGCRRQFEAWDGTRKDRFVSTALGAMSEERSAPTTQPAAEAPKGDPYPLSTCPVSGQPLGSMGDPIVKAYDGREVRFCCGGCIGRFESAKEEHFAKIDQQIIRAQRPYYPLTTCVVMGDELVDEGEDAAIDHVYRNRLVRLCCKGCVRRFEKSPTEYLKKIDEALIKQQRAAYPTDTCVVGGGKLGSMGEPVEVIAGNRLVRFCCAGCIPQFKKDPAKYLTMVDNAWKTKGGVPR